MAKTVTFAGTIETFEGAVIPKLSYSAEYVELVKGDTIPAAEMLSEDDIRNAVNAARKQNARSKAVNATLEASGYVKKTVAEKLQDTDYQIAQMARVFVARGMSETDAIAQAKEILGL